MTVYMIENVPRKSIWLLSLSKVLTVVSSITIFASIALIQLVPSASCAGERPRLSSISGLSPGGHAPLCSALLGHETSALATRQSKDLSAFVKAFPEIDQRIGYWTERARGATRSRRLEILDEASGYAASLIRAHKNEEFFYLAKHFEFPINKTGDEFYTDGDEPGHEEHFVYFGRSLLEVAIYSKNYEVYRKLPTLSRQVGWSHEQTPFINRWIQPLAAAVVNDPVFSKDALVIAYRDGGPEFSGDMATHGILSESAMERLQRAGEKNDVEEVMRILSEFLPDGEMAVVVKRSETDRVWGKLYLDYAPDRELGGVVQKGTWAHMKIHDPEEFRRHLFGGGHYRTQTHFNIQLESKIRGIERLASRGELNVIRKIKTSSRGMSILLERDGDGKAYDRGTRFQELVVVRDEQSGRIKEITIRNGNNLLAQQLWKSQTVEIPKNTTVSSGAFFLGEEDMATNVINHK